MARFVKFPGTAGSYASTDDVNLLDADTAHIQQGIGEWIANQAVPVSTPQTPPVAPPFGTLALQADVQSAAPSTVTTNTITILPTTEYSVSLWIYTTAAAQGVQGRPTWYNSGVFQGSTDWVGTITAGAWSNLTATFTTTASTNELKMFVGLDNPAASDVFYLSAVCLRLGSDATFVPSLRIVGDIELETKITPNLLLSFQGLVCKQFDGDANNGWLWSIDNAGGVRFRPGFGASSVDLNSTSYGFAAGTTVVVKTEYTAADRVATFYKDGVLVNATAPGASGVMAHVDSVATAGSQTASASMFDGDMFTGTVRDGIAGPIVAQFNADDIPIP